MNIDSQVHKVVSKYLGVAESEISNESHLKDDLNSDPLSLADLVVSLEDEFSISIPPEDSQNFTTVGDIVDYISESIGEV
jgi:acyl carrier protein